MQRIEVVALAATVLLAVFALPVVLGNGGAWFRGVRDFLVPILSRTYIEEARPEAFAIATLLTLFGFAAIPVTLLLLLASLNRRRRIVRPPVRLLAGMITGL